jgi:signal transduction histidine kinase
LAPSSELLRDFEGIGVPLAWFAAALVAAIAVAYGGWTPWLGRFAHLLATYAIMHLALSTLRRFGGDPPVALTVVLLPAFATSAALMTTTAYRAANASANLPNGSAAFDIGVSMSFALSLVAWEVMQREAEHRRKARDALALENETRERQFAELKLGLLQAQIEPHFIYNTLANVQQLVRTSPVDADLMLESLIRYLKASIPEVRSGMSTVGQELARAQAYLAIMGIRMGERLRYEVDVSPDLHSLPIPPLGLMTLVENAVRHGLDAKREGGLVRIEGKKVGTNLRLSVVDDGAGFSQEIGDGIGLSNLRARIATLHGARGTLELSHRDPEGVEATLLLPVD